MITHRLEKLIHSGKASYNTFVAGGTEKHILNVQNDRYIIITDLTFYSSVNVPELVVDDTMLEDLLKAALNTQFKIFSEKSTNQFLVRNSFNITETAAGGRYYVIPGQPTKLDVYLIHESDVSISFSYAGGTSNELNGISKSDVVAYPPPYDYGKDGQSGALAVRKIGRAAASYKNAFQGQSIVDTTPGTLDLQFSFPVDNTTQYKNLNHSINYPILNIGYVEIIGNPTNLSMSI